MLIEAEIQHGKAHLLEFCDDNIYTLQMAEFNFIELNYVRFHIAFNRTVQLHEITRVKLPLNGHDQRYIRTYILGKTCGPEHNPQSA